MENLNEEQRQAVEAIEGPVLVIAGPGSGKTELLSMRAAHILRTTDTPPSSILCLTFTDAAAANMRHRLARIMGRAAYQIAIHTFHSFGAEIITRYPEYFYNGAAYEPIDDLIRIQLMEEIFSRFTHDNPLNAYHPVQGYTYLGEVLSKISELKRGGITPAEFTMLLDRNADFLEHATPYITEFCAKNTIRSIAQLEKVEALVQDLAALPNTETTLPYATLKETLCETLTEALKKARELGSTRPFTSWKDHYTKKDRENRQIFKDAERLPRHYALAEVYRHYQELLHEKGYFDYDDMLMEVVRALTENPELKYSLQEKYLYYMVDEFQDTSGVQMRLLQLLLDNPAHEERPNVLAVGDDDQSIFKFQGANLYNLLKFHASYRDTRVIVLTKNYRSTSEILSFARRVIIKGADRLENHIPEVTKELVAAGASPGTGEIVQQECLDETGELVWIAQKIKEKLSTGTSPQEIAVIATRHRRLQECAQILSAMEIPVYYEKRRNILQEPLIHQLTIMLEFVHSLLDTHREPAEHLLPEILSYPLWGISQYQLWQLSLTAHRTRTSWLTAMMESQEPTLQTIARFFITLAQNAKTSTAEEVIDMLLGSVPVALAPSHEYTSPFRTHYFPPEKLTHETGEYLRFLSHLEIFIEKIRAYSPRRGLTLEEALRLIELHRTHKIAMYDTVKQTRAEDAVHLLTAHGAKGREFETVFIVSCQDEVWAKKMVMDKLGFPVNIPLSPDPDTEEDMLRLFYVALTRAKRNIYLSYYGNRNDGRDTLRVRFLEGIEGGELRRQERDTTNATHTHLSHAPRILQLEKDHHTLLTEALGNYQLSASHLHSFLNIVDAGPQDFLQNKIVRFPQMRTLQKAYGTAMHAALHRFHTVFKKDGTLPPLETLHHFFSEALASERLSEHHFTDQLRRGQRQLQVYYEYNAPHLNPQDITELSFNNQQVQIGDALLTGTIDRLSFEGGAACIIEYKTGKVLPKWEYLYAEDQLRAWRYRTQLQFYALLLENSRDFREKGSTKEGRIEFLDALYPREARLPLTITATDLEKLAKLVEVVYQKITTLDFPDTSRYPSDIVGVQMFIEDLVSGRI